MVGQCLTVSANKVGVKELQRVYGHLGENYTEVSTREKLLQRFQKIKQNIQSFQKCEKSQKYQALMLVPLYFIFWIKANYRHSTHQELRYLNFDLTN